jgi:alpha-beta hydrolase superfamily lysophospholipase
MQISEWNWKSFDSLDMYARGWVPQGKPRAAILLVHGHGEHVERYDHVAAALTDAGYAMLAFDLRGHGKSGGARGHTPSYEALMNDIDSGLKQVDLLYAGLPRFLYGHSLGGNLVLNYALRRKPALHGVISTGPWLKLAFEPPVAQMALGRLMNGIAPGLIQHSKLETRGLSHDLAVVSAYDHDPLNHDKISVRLFMAMQASGLWALEHAAEFPLPLLLMHGAADPITSAKASQEFAEKVGAKVTFKAWDGLYHEIHNEPQNAEVFKFMLDWLAEH